MAEGDDGTPGGGNGSPPAEKIIDWERRFALRAIIQYLYAVGAAKQTEIYQRAGIKRQEMGYYFRPNHSGDNENKLSFLFRKLAPAARTFLDRKHPGGSYPDFLAGFVDLVFETTSIESDGKKFLSQKAIAKNYWPDKEQIPRFLDQYAGLWWVVRISTETSERNKPQINVGLLSIWPHRALKGPVPHFVFYFKSKFADRGEYVRASGEMFVSARSLHFLGARRGDGTLFSMRWPSEDVGVDTEQGKPVHKRTSWGLATMTSATGKTIAAHTRAIFIPNSSDLGEGYESAKDKYREEIGVRSVEDCVSQNLLTQSDLDQLVAFSDQDLVLSIRY